MPGPRPWLASSSSVRLVCDRGSRTEAVQALPCLPRRLRLCQGLLCEPLSQHPPAYTLSPGFGDSAASLVGRLWGDHALAADNPKTWEGLAAGSAATLAGWVGVALLSSALPGVALLSPQPTQGGLLAATSLSCFLEAVTGQLDNAVLPLHYYTLLLCLA